MVSKQVKKLYVEKKVNLKVIVIDDNVNDIIDTNKVKNQFIKNNNKMYKMIYL